MTSNQSSAGEQGASFENGTPRCDATHRKAKFKSQSRHVVGPFETDILADAWSKAHGCGEGNAGEAEVSKATQSKRDERAEDVKNAVMQYVVKVPIEDEGASRCSGPLDSLLLASHRFTRRSGPL